LATAYSKRILGNRVENLKRSIANFKASLTVLKPELLPDNCRKTARLLGNLYADNQYWAEAIEAYKMALEATEILYQASLSRSSQEAELGETGDLFRRAAYAKARAGNLEMAVVTAEVGRARRLSETLERDRADLTALGNTVPEPYQQYQQAAEALRQLEVDERSTSSSTQENQSPRSQAELRQRAETVRQDMQDAIAAIRQIPGYEAFLDQPTFDDIAMTVQPDHPLVYLLPTSNGSLALVIHQSHAAGNVPGPVHVSPLWLDSLTEASLQELLEGSGEDSSGWFGAYNNWNTDRSTWFETIDQVTHQLWDEVMGAVVTHLKSLNAAQAILIPTGYLSFLPLHAAWTEDAAIPTGRRYALDAMTFTYAPNARSLTAAREIAHRTSTDSILAIDEPKHHYKDKNGTYRDLSPLPNSCREVEVAIATFSNSKVLSR
jgi:tetratricopeptide (TPR) repeat protein